MEAVGSSVYSFILLLLSRLIGVFLRGSIFSFSYFSLAGLTGQTFRFWVIGVHCTVCPRCLSFSKQKLIKLIKGGKKKELNGKDIRWFLFN